MRQADRRGRVLASVIGAACVVSQARAGAATTLAAPAPAIQGWYYPDTGRFVPLPAPDLNTTTYEGIYDVTFQIQFIHSSPLDYPRVFCSVSLSFFGVASANGNDSASGSIQFDPSVTSKPSVSLRYKVTTTAASPQMQIDTSCTAYDSNGVGHSRSGIVVRPLINFGYFPLTTVIFP